MDQSSDSLNVIVWMWVDWSLRGVDTYFSTPFNVMIFGGQLLGMMFLLVGRNFLICPGNALLVPVTSWFEGEEVFSRELSL